MHVVYTLWGLGFADDEDSWELCGVYATREAAEAASAVVHADDDGDYTATTRIDEEVVQQ